MINRVAPLVCLALLCGATACSGDAVTQIVVSVGTDMIIPDELDVLQFQAGYDQVNDAVEIEWELDRNKVGYIELPATIGLLPGPKNGKRPVLLTARAVREQNQVVVRQARLPFAEGRILLLKLNLLRRCIGVTCSEDESCGELGCEKIDKNPDLLPSYSADAAFAGVADQGDVDLALLQGFQAHVVVHAAVAQDQSASHGVALGAGDAAAPVAGVGLDDDG